MNLVTIGGEGEEGFKSESGWMRKGAQPAIEVDVLTLGKKESGCSGRTSKDLRRMLSWM